MNIRVHKLTNKVDGSTQNNLIILMGKSIVIILLGIVLLISAVFLVMLVEGLIPLIF
jgi:hypothetical protein